MARSRDVSIVEASMSSEFDIVTPNGGKNTVLVVGKELTRHGDIERRQTEDLGVAPQDFYKDP